MSINKNDRKAEKMYDIALRIDPDNEQDSAGNKDVVTISTSIDDFTSQWSLESMVKSIQQKKMMELLQQNQQQQHLQQQQQQQQQLLNNNNNNSNNSKVHEVNKLSSPPLEGNSHDDQSILPIIIHFVSIYSMF